MSLAKLKLPSPAKLAIIAALEREVAGLVRGSTPLKRTHAGRAFTFFEDAGRIIVCGGIGYEAARRAAEAAIAMYHPVVLQSVGFAGALRPDLQVGDIFTPATIIDARDGSRTEVAGGKGVLLTFMAVAGKQQKLSLALSYSAQAVDMEAAGVAAAALAHGIEFGAVKVISDELDFEMPQTSRFIDPQGRFSTGRFALFVSLRPWLWKRVATLASNSRKAAKALAVHLKAASNPVNHLDEANTTWISSNR